MCSKANAGYLGVSNRKLAYQIDRMRGLAGLSRNPVGHHAMAWNNHLTLVEAVGHRLSLSTKLGWANNDDSHRSLLYCINGNAALNYTYF